MTDIYSGKTAQEWHDIALTWKRRAMNAEIRLATAERDADLLADRLLEGEPTFEPADCTCGLTGNHLAAHVPSCPLRKLQSQPRWSGRDGERWSKHSRWVQSMLDKYPHLFCRHCTRLGSECQCDEGIR